MCILADSAAIGLSSRPACAGQCRSSQPTTARLRRLVSAWRLAAKKKGENGADGGAAGSSPPPARDSERQLRRRSLGPGPRWRRGRSGNFRVPDSGGRPPYTVHNTPQGPLLG